ncbi:iron-sulfur cluster assembly protein [Chitinophaga sedimenti]|uniref:iron-sulfur cluster assembly protein n=1 Tax=Chitinophaga sedimenti TaxID=2033606 RepID=UPI002004C893|nr:iron-sulfur cluster assembly protein [Chitinophaga sedimenti]MCK7554389.1 iron-sulfur cluster assembly protein [Chitinophaga sedimenti]
MDGAQIRDKVDEALRTVFDPEIPVNIVELGLVYQTDVMEDGRVLVIMTLTAPGCPVAGSIIEEVTQKIEAIEGVSTADVRLTFDPPWNKEMMSEEARLELGFM